MPQTVVSIGRANDNCRSRPHVLTAASLVLVILAIKEGWSAISGSSPRFADKYSASDLELISWGVWAVIVLFSAHLVRIHMTIQMVDENVAFFHKHVANLPVPCRVLEYLVRLAILAAVGYIVHHMYALRALAAGEQKPVTDLLGEFAWMALIVYALLLFWDLVMIMFNGLAAFFSESGELRGKRLLEWKVQLRLLAIAFAQPRSFYFVSDISMMALWIVVYLLYGPAGPPAWLLVYANSRVLLGGLCLLFSLCAVTSLVWHLCTHLPAYGNHVMGFIGVPYWGLKCAFRPDEAAKNGHLFEVDVSEALPAFAALWHTPEDEVSVTFEYDEREPGSPLHALQANRPACAQPQTGHHSAARR